MKKLLNKKLVVIIIVLASATAIFFIIDHHREIDSRAFRSQARIERNILSTHELFLREHPPAFDDGFGNIIEFPYYEGYSLFLSFAPPFQSGGRAYVFKPGTTREEIKDTIGFENLAGFVVRSNDGRLDHSPSERWRGIPRVVREGYAQILFVSNNNISHSWEEYAITLSLHANTFYTFDFGDFGDNNYIRILYENNPRVRVMEEKEDGKIVIRLISQDE